MTLSIRQIHPTFAGEVTGVNCAKPLSPDDVAAIEAGMDQYGVLVFHDQPLTDEAQMAFSRNFGDLEISSGGEMAKPGDRRLKLEMADISNLDRDSKLRPADDRVRLSALGNRLWQSLPSIPFYQPASSQPPAETPSSPTCAPPTTPSTPQPRPRSRIW